MTFCPVFTGVQPAAREGWTGEGRGGLEKGGEGNKTLGYKRDGTSHILGCKFVPLS